MDEKNRSAITDDTLYKSSTAVQILSVPAVFIIYYFIKYLNGILVIYPHLNLQDEWWVKAFDHHFIQMICALVVIGVLSKGRWQKWGLNFRNYNKSIQILKRFLLYYGVYFIGIGFVVQLLFFSAPTMTEDVTVRSIIGKLAFGFLFVGVSEEILFRGLFHSFLALFWVGMIRWRTIEIPIAGVIAAIVFTVAHIDFSITPFEVTHLYVPQLVMAFALGLFYSWAYYCTDSLLAPILAHNFSNSLLWVSEYLLLWWHT